MRFFKAHGLGNDYLAAESGVLPELTPPRVRLLCDRHRGFGSDGILLHVPSATADFGVRIFNPDGSEAEKSGNGLRIFAAYLLDRGEVEAGRPFSVETLGGIVEMEVLSRTGAELMVEVEMGTASFHSADVGLTGPDREVVGEQLELESGEKVAINTVSIGNPHCVVFDDELVPEHLRRLGPLLSTHPSFARGTNVQFVRAVDPVTVEAWVWERGAGETQASGSSACAVAAVAARRGLVSGSPIAVNMPGGTLEVTIHDNWKVRLRGPVEPVYVAEIGAGLQARLEEL